jgi:hypothetical protein
MTKRFFFGAAAAGLLSLLSLGCDADHEGSDSGSSCSGGKCDEADGDELEDRSVCVALRGNGEKVFSTFTSMAGVVEHYGPLEGAAGGSSGSIATFVAESIHMSPVLYDCGYTTCSDEEAGVRAALMFKSLQGYFQVLSESDEAVALGNLAPLAAKVKAAGLQELAAEDIVAAQSALVDLLSSDDFRGLVNPELLQTLQNSPAPQFHVRDLIDGLSNFGSFDTSGAEILVRPGLVDTDQLSELLGRIGSFYAGYAPADTRGMKYFLDTCAEPSRGMNWAEASQLPAGASQNCGELFADLVTDYRDQVRADGADFPSRSDDLVSEGRFHALIATSVLTADAADTWRQARTDYNAAQDWSLDVDFEDVKYGWFGSPADLEQIAENPEGYPDLKTAKTVGLGQVTWREALKYSPAEPGIARALEIDGTDMVSAGGWPDLHPVLALKNIGCDEVVYITRTGKASNFSSGMARMLNADDEQMRQLYDLESPDSSFSVSLSEADATWCTNWDDIPGLEMQRITDDAYHAALETDDEFFSSGDNAYEGTIPRSEGRLGCSLEASQGQ